MRWVSCSALVFALAFVSSPARADEDAAHPYFVATTASMVFSVPMDVGMWATVGTTELRNHWAWHFIPIAGPIIGFNSIGRDFSSCDDPQGQWCKLANFMLYLSQSLVLVGETVGLVTLGVGLYKLQQPSQWETSSQRLAPKTWLAPQMSPRIMPQLWTTQQTAWLGASGTW